LEAATICGKKLKMEITRTSQNRVAARMQAGVSSLVKEERRIGTNITLIPYSVPALDGRR
jgi:hypothetical protein